MLAQHEPFPAFVVDRRWNLLRANRGAGRLVEFLSGPISVSPKSEPVNLAIALMSPDGLRPAIANWEEVAAHFLRGVQADAQCDLGENRRAHADVLPRVSASRFVVGFA